MRFNKKIFYFSIVLLGSCLTFSWASSDSVNFHDDFESSTINPSWDSFFIAPPENVKEKKKLAKKIKNGDVTLREVALKSPSLQLVSDPVREGRHSLKITVRPKDALASNDEEKGKSRAEIGIKNGGIEGRQMWYKWSVYIPSDYPEVPEGVNDFQVITQFHRYVKRIGKRYADYTSLRKSERKKAEGVSPAVVVRYHHEKGQSYFIFNYGYKEDRKEVSIPIEKGKWYDWQLNVRWSTKSDGFVNAKIDGRDIHFEGPNMYTSSPVEARWGIYRGHHKFKTINSIYLDDVYVTDESPKL